MRAGHQAPRHILRGDDIVILQNQSAFDHVTQLSHISRPVILPECFSHVVLKPTHSLTQPLAKRRDVVLSKLNHVVTAVSQRRNIDLNHGQPVVKVEPEAARLALCPQVPIRGRDDPCVERNVLQSTDSAECSFFKHAQKFCLQAELQLADLVQQEGAALGLFEHSFFAGLGVGEGALLVPKQFAFDQGARNCGAVDRDEWPIGTIRLVMDRFGHQVLARAGFSLQQN